MNRNKIDLDTVYSLIRWQFPQWKNLDITPVKSSGWDNLTFHLGEQMAIRMPAAACYAPQVKVEQEWLPRLAPHLPLTIPHPLALGKPCDDYPWHWSIYEWLPGTTAVKRPPTDQFALFLAHFLQALHAIPTRGGPLPAERNFYRGGDLAVYDQEVRQVTGVRDVLDLWEEGLATQWEKEPVWVHGDIAPGNLLLQDGKLSSVIDFGLLAIGDPACDLAIAWAYFDKERRALFRNALPLDDATWARGRAWALWKALISNDERTVDAILE